MMEDKIFYAQIEILNLFHCLEMLGSAKMFNPYFEEVKLAKTIYNPCADNEEELYQRIYVCKKPKQDFDKMKELFKTRIFE